MADQTDETGVPQAAQKAAETLSPAPARRRPERGVRGGRTQLVKMRASDEEKAEIEARAQAARLTPSGYLRARALDDPGPRTRRVPPVNAQALAPLTVQLVRLGNNVNRMATALNAYGRSAQRDEAEELYRDIAVTLAAIRAAVTGRGAP
jgi:type II secretory pathway component PulF